MAATEWRIIEPQKPEDPQAGRDALELCMALRVSVGKTVSLADAIVLLDNVPHDTAQEVARNRRRIRTPLSLNQPIRNPDSLGLDTLERGDTLPSTGLNPEEEYARIESERQFRMLIETSNLEPHERTVLEMCIDRVGGQQIANALGFPLRDIWRIAEVGIAKIRNNPQIKSVENDHANQAVVF